MLAGQHEAQKRPWLCVSTVQQRIKYRLSTLICINTNPKHSTTWAVMKKINSTTDKTSIHLYVKMKNFSLHFQFVVWKWAFYVYVVIHALRDLRKPIWFILAKRKLTGMWNCNLSILLVQNFMAMCVGFLDFNIFERWQNVNTFAFSFSSFAKYFAVCILVIC